MRRVEDSSLATRAAAGRRRERGALGPAAGSPGTTLDRACSGAPGEAPSPLHPTLTTRAIPSSEWPERTGTPMATPRGLSPTDMGHDATSVEPST